MFFLTSRRRHTIWNCDLISDVCSSDLVAAEAVKSGTAFSAFTGHARRCPSSAAKAEKAVPLLTASAATYTLPFLTVSPCKIARAYGKTNSESYVLSYALMVLVTQQRSS